MVLRGIFGPSKDEVWGQFANEMGGEYINKGVFKPKQVIVEFEGWVIILDSFSRSHGKSSTTYTRIRTPYNPIDRLQFKIYKSGLFSDLGKALGMQDIEIGEVDFDEKFIIKGDSEDKVREFLSGDKIKELIMKLDRFSIEIKHGEGMFSSNLVEGSHELYYESVGIIKDVNRLKELFMLYILLLDKLLNMGIADKVNIESTMKGLRKED
ncbi:MAG: hypothetical protein WCY46_00350 [Tissierellaceae bacterium]